MLVPKRKIRGDTRHHDLILMFLWSFGARMRAAIVTAAVSIPSTPKLASFLVGYL